MLQERVAATQREIALSKDVGPQHPDLIKVKSTLADLNKQIDSRVKGIVFTLQTKVDALKAEVDQRKTAVEAAKSNDIYQARMAQPYFEAKNELESLKNFARTMEMKIAASRIDAAQPRVRWSMSWKKQSLQQARSSRTNRSTSLSASSLAWSSALAWHSSSNISTPA